MCCYLLQQVAQPKPSLLRALVATFGGPYFALGVLKVGGTWHLAADTCCAAHM